MPLRLEGDLSHAGTRMSASARLVDVGSGEVRWAERFSVSAEELFSVEDVIAERVVDALKLRVAASAQQRLRQRHTVNAAAYQQYLRGLAAMAERNEAKGKLIYDYLDASPMFTARAQQGSRSLMNVCFNAKSEELEAKFLAEATKRGLDGLKGHRSAGGIRASTYNAMPIEGVRALVDFMKEFEKANS